MTGTEPSHPLWAFPGSYEHEIYGAAEVTEEDGHLVLRIGTSFVGDLQHWHYDTFRANYRDRYQGRDFVTFTVDRRGRVSGMEVQGLGLFRKQEEEGAER